MTRSSEPDLAIQFATGGEGLEGADSDRPTDGARGSTAFLLRLAEVLHAYGTPAHRLEDVLAETSRQLSVEGQFFSSPTSILVAFGRAEQQRTFLLRVQPGDVDLGKLVEFEEVLERLEAGQLDARAARDELDRIAGSAPRYGSLWTSVAFAAASASAAVFFAGGLLEIGISAAIGFAMGQIARLTGRRSATARVFEPTAAFTAAFLAMACAIPFPTLAVPIVTLSGLIVLLPGLAVTVAMTELATRHLLSGTARLAGAGAVFLTILLGVALGRRVGGLWLPQEQVALAHSPLPAWTTWLAVLVGAVAFAQLFQARIREYGVILLACLIGYCGVRLSASTLGPELAPFVGALLVGLFGNGYARRFRRPSSVPILPGILLMVPGSLGFRSLTFFLAEDVLGGMEQAFSMALVAVSLVGGLLAANVFAVPRRSL